MDTEMYKALNEAWEKQLQIPIMKMNPFSVPSWGDGFWAGWQAGMKEKEKGDKP